MNEAVFKVAGVSFAEGYPQNLLSVSDSGGLHCKLMREPQNPHDSNAIKVICVAAGGAVGHVPRELAAALAPLMDGMTPKGQHVFITGAMEVLVNPDYEDRPGAVVRVKW